MKKLLFIIIGTLGFAGVAFSAPTSTIIKYLILNPAITGDPTLCLQRLSSGLVVTSTADCGSGGGGTTDWIGSGSILTASTTYNVVQVFGTVSSTEIRSASGTISGTLQVAGNLTDAGNNKYSTSTGVTGSGTSTRLAIWDTSNSLTSYSTLYTSAGGSILIVDANTLFGMNIDLQNNGISNAGLVTGMTFTNASGTNLSLSGYLQSANVSTTNITALGFLQSAVVSSTNITASGFFQGASLNISGQSSLASVSSTNLEASGYLNVTATSTLLRSLLLGTSTNSSSSAIFTIATTTNILTVLSSNGNLGVGTADPSARLTVQSPVINVDLIKIRNTTNVNGYSSIGFFDYLNAQSGGFGYGNPGSSINLRDTIYFYSINKNLVWSTNSGNNIRLAVSQSNGFVGIWTSRPSSTLHINNLPSADSAMSMVLFGVNNIKGGSGAGTYLGINTTNTYAGDYLNFQFSSSTVLKISSSSVTVGTSTSIGVGTSTVHSKITIVDGDIYLTSSTRGLILTSPDGSCSRLTVSDADVGTFTGITCP